MISVVIVNFNAGELLDRCVAAVLEQSLPALEVFVIDNDSSDGSAKRIGEKFPSVYVVNSGANIGFAAANNLALKMLSNNSRWVALLNPDAFPEPDWLETLFAATREYPEYAFFGSRLMDANRAALVDGIGDVYHLSGLIWRCGHGQVLNPACLKPAEIFSPCAAAAMYRKDLLMESGGFDEKFFCYVEDVDLGFRLRLLGHRCLYVPGAVAFHIGSALSGARSAFSVYHGHRNLVWAFFKNMPGILFWVLLPLHLVFNLLTLFHLGLRGQAKIVLRAKRDAFKEIPTIWRARQRIQSQRVVSLGEIWRLMDKRMIPARRPCSRTMS